MLIIVGDIETLTLLYNHLLINKYIETTGPKKEGLSSSISTVWIMQFQLISNSSEVQRICNA